jgi:PKD repeat protein
MTFMEQRLFGTICAVVAAALIVGGCTMKKQETPDLSGPSEFGTSIVVSVSPDILSQDGTSQSMVTVSASDPNGPKRGLTLRAEINVGGIPADFGSLSARSISTDSNGKAIFFYTAPAAPSVAVDEGTVVTIVVTPTNDGDFGNAAPRVASIRLIPPGIIVPPDGLKAAFTFSPSSPNDSQPVLFDASGSSAANGNAIASYSWNFGDGGSASGKLVSHAFRSGGTYVVTLTVSDSLGRTGQAAQTITVAPGVNPTAAFSSSPSDPLINQPVNFNASASVAAPGRTITKYDWDFGDGTFGSGAVTSHTYSLARSYVIVLTVTDDSGKKGTATGTVAPR